MPAGQKPRSARQAAKKTNAAPTHKVADVMAWIKRTGTRQVRDGMARFAIPADKAVGIPVGTLRAYAKKLGHCHALAADLWQTDCYEARLLAVFVEDVSLVSSAQMDAWCRDFDNWAICDTACFHLFDRTPHAWRKISQWAPKRSEFVRRAAFALLASMTVHDKQADDELFAQGLTLIERAAGDERNFVKKAVNWALRSIGKRNLSLHAAAVVVAERLAESKSAPARWIGKDALRELNSAAVVRRLSAKQAKSRQSSQRASRKS